MKFFSPIVWQLMVKTLLWTLTSLTIGVLFFIIFVVFVNGLTQLSWEFLSTNPADMGRSGGILATIVSTLYIIVIALLFATPLGLGTAIYLTEYTREGPGTRIIRFGTECLAGIPSIILGMARAIGETMAVIMVAGNALKIPGSVLDPVRTLTSTIALEMGYSTGDHRQALFAAGIILFVFIMGLNILATTLMRRK